MSKYVFADFIRALKKFEAKELMTLVSQYCMAKYYRVKLDVPRKEVKDILSKHDLGEAMQDWFLNVYDKRWRRVDFWGTCLWISKNIPKNKAILELGVGCGWNLLWLAREGFTNLSGIDIDSHALSALSDFAEQKKIAINTTQADFFHFENDEKLYDVIFSLSAIRLSEKFSPDSFLGDFSKKVTVGGFIIFDVIDTAYNRMPNNQYHTQDWDKPVDQRRPTERPNRFGKIDIQKAAENNGFEILYSFTNPLDRMCVNVYFLKRIV